MDRWYDETVPAAFARLTSAPGGLSNAEAAKRLAAVGPNALPEPKTRGWFVIFLDQFRSPLIYLLLAAGAILVVLGDATDGAIVGAVLLVNAGIGAIQEGRAQNTLRALQKFVETRATVVRDGHERLVRDTEVVPGDVVVLTEGEKVPADLRVFMARDLRANESALTGESEPVHKTDATLPPAGRDAAPRPLPAQENMVFRGTSIVGGDGLGVAVATGRHTEIGKISETLVGLDTEIPLKANLRALARTLTIGTVVFTLLLFVVGVLVYDYPLVYMFTLGVALAVSFIPEGLPVALTLILATGVWRMAKQHALVKKLHAVEALGQARVIAVDKTGTLTKNELVVTEIFSCGTKFRVTGEGYEPTGGFFREKEPADPARDGALALALNAAASTATARVSFDEEAKIWRVGGDPTEAALLVLARKAGLRNDAWDEAHPLLREIPFSYEYKYRAAVRMDAPGKERLFVIGAPEAVMAHATTFAPASPKRGARVPRVTARFTKREREAATVALHAMLRRGLRVLAFGYAARVPKTLTTDTLPPLTFGGFIGMKDTLRAEVPEALRRAEGAGMRVVMVTGDHKLTAEVVAREAGILKEKGKVLTGTEIETMTDEELAEVLGETDVFARVTPSHKLRIIEAFRKRGEIIAMTGDGVNDAPPLVAADLGVAMGRVGTEVAKEAADIVLLDDNFGSIVAAVEEGRNIYRTLRKVLQFLLSTNMSEVFLITFAILAGFALPLQPSQIIWLNFVTDTFLVAALAMEPKEKDLLQGPARRSRRALVDGGMAVESILMGLFMMAGTFLVFSHYLDGGDIVKAQTMALTVLAVFQWYRAWTMRSDNRSIVSMNPRTNPFLIAATVTVVFLHLAVLHVPFLQAMFHTMPLSITEWGLALLVGLGVVVADELRMRIRRRFAW
ncbi:MAG: HAD-IC family P-type ATPase [Candidatus Jorgensenbacteria bacterium]|nr:HAD-IC family P-type ATPase [Candidatus Jorgensenbacteria bacterium]